MYQYVYDKILFTAMICFSFFTAAYTISMNKEDSLFKLLGWSFIIPFGLCCSAFVFSSNVPLNLILSFSEFCLSVSILILILHPYNTKNHKAIAFVIAFLTLFLSVFAIKLEQFIYYTFSATLRNILTAVCIIAAIVFNKKRNGDKKLAKPLIIWLIGIVPGIVKSQVYINEIILLAKLSAYAYFLLYFFGTIHNSIMKKIDESEKLIESMKKSLNKEVKKRVFEIERSNERLLEISKTDMLTKTYNKITILSIIEKLISSKKMGIFSILMFDIDNFKIINDSLGHVTGDKCLKSLAAIASGNIREVDYIGRYGGDEFIIVLPTLAENEARFVAERFRKKVNEISNPKFTVSIGIATYPYDGQTVHDLISAADKGLYKAKSKGKNTVCHWSLF
ncbi:MAG: GGDEF domain-containing protein [Lutisporaceae bacterium]|jgi:diguanylate cyclase (GGDEF)-like protein